jgi:hypothetical protein
MSGLYFTVDWAILGSVVLHFSGTRASNMASFRGNTEYWSVAQQILRALMSLQLKWCERVAAGLNLRAYSTFAQ